MNKVWVAKCHHCGELAAVKPSATTSCKIDLTNYSDQLFQNHQCPNLKCLRQNDFHASELFEVDADILLSEPNCEDK